MKQEYKQLQTRMKQHYFATNKKEEYAKYLINRLVEDEEEIELLKNRINTINYAYIGLSNYMKELEKRYTKEEAYKAWNKAHKELD